MGYAVPPLSRSDIRYLAKALRRAFRINGTNVDIVRLVENRLYELLGPYKYSFEIGSEEEMGINHGLTIPERNSIMIREDVYEGACRGNGRDRFTLAHELGHFLMHKDCLVGLARVGTGEKLPAYRDSEWQANAFAGEFLMDSDVIRGMSAEEIAEQCGVSLDAARTQLRAQK